VNYIKLLKKLLSDGIHSWIVSILLLWYSHLQVSVLWNRVLSSPFCISNGTRQGGILSPTLFNRYVLDMIVSLLTSRVGCNVGGLFVNILAYADDMAILAPSWHALQDLIKTMEYELAEIDMLCNTKKTVCMVFSPTEKRKIVATSFPPPVLNNEALKCVTEFKYLGHIICNNLSDDKYISREIRNLFVRTNMLSRRFGSCSFDVKIALFRSFCICFYGSALWQFIV